MCSGIVYTGSHGTLGSVKAQLAMRCGFANYQLLRERVNDKKWKMFCVAEGDVKTCVVDMCYTASTDVLAREVGVT